MIRHWSHARQKGWGYPPKKTAYQSGLRFQRYKPLKSVTTAGRPAGRPLILRFLVYISRNSLRASRSLVTIAIAEKQSKRSKKGPFSLYIGPPGPTQEMELMGPRGEGPSRSPPVSPAMRTSAGIATALAGLSTTPDQDLGCVRRAHSPVNIHHAW